MSSLTLLATSLSGKSFSIFDIIEPNSIVWWGFFLSGTLAKFMLSLSITKSSTFLSTIILSELSYISPFLIPRTRAEPCALMEVLSGSWW